MKKLNYKQCSQLALQAALQPIDDSRFFAGGLIDGLTRSKNLQICLSGAVNGMSPVFSHLPIAAIHNYQLSIILPPIQQKTGGKRKNATAFFPFFTLTNTGPWLGQKVNRGFLAIA